MIKSFEREKLLQAIVFFTTNTKRCGVVKLFKLLYYLDMLHFRETGRSVTGLHYRALPYGPVPVELYDELDEPRQDLGRAIAIEPKMVDIGGLAAPRGNIIKPKVAVQVMHLTAREKRIANELAEIFLEASGQDISEISHAKNGPWELAKKRGNGKWGTPIDYLDSVNLAIGSGQAMTREELAELAAEYEETRNHFA
jgi:uncharacterized phage-associated protein